MSIGDENEDIGALLGRDGGGPPPEIDARVRAYARERTDADSVQGPVGTLERPVRAGGTGMRSGTSNRWWRVLPAVAVVALAVTLVPLVRDEAPSGRASGQGAEAVIVSAKGIGTDADAARPEGTASEPSVVVAPTGAVDSGPRSGDAEAVVATSAEVASARAAPVPSADAPASLATRSSPSIPAPRAPPEAFLESETMFDAAEEAVPADPVEAPAAIGTAPAGESARAVLVLLREGAPPASVARALRAWRERWPDVSFEAVSDVTGAELDTLRALAPGAMPR